jgi:hypothetical protein
MKLNIFYKKNKSYFQKDKKIIDCKNIQNYNPIYNELFKTTLENYNEFQLNYKWNTTEILSRIDHNVVKVILENDQHVTKEAEIFIKYSPLLDPIKYLTGKYSTTQFLLPSIEESNTVHPKLLNYHNNAYIDGFFSYVSSILLNAHGFIHGLDFYGSYLANQTDYRVNIYDDFDYLCSNRHFIKNMDTHFKEMNLPSIAKPRLIIKENTVLVDDIVNIAPIEEKAVELENDVLTEIHLEFESPPGRNDTMEHTSEAESSEEDNTSDEGGSETGSETGSEMGSETGSEMGSEMGSETGSETGSEEEEDIFAYIEDFPVHVICLEKCTNTLDAYMMTHTMTEDEWTAVLMQIIMTLLMYQKCFNFTHNDLHTNNIMYCETDKSFVHYHFNSTYYKVPTFGKIWKIIDFGRAIYTVNNNTYASDCFFPEEDAFSQYNCEPFLNPKKKIIKPNNSFDLCRLACSLYDFFIDDEQEILDPIQLLVSEWCDDDNGKNILYKSNGDERYPEFKLYKMIARIVHKHTPEAQLERDLFKKFIVSKKLINNKKAIMHIKS